MSGYAVLLLAVVMVLAYAALTRRLIRMTRPLRERLIKIGEELLSHPGVSKARKQHVARVLDGQLSAKTAWTFAVCITFAGIAATIDMVLRKPAPARDLPPDLRAKWAEFSLLRIVSALMVSPAAMVLFVVQLVPILLTSVSLAAVSDRLAGIMRNGNKPHQDSVRQAG